MRSTNFEYGSIVPIYHELVLIKQSHSNPKDVVPDSAQDRHSVNDDGSFDSLMSSPIPSD